MSTPKRHAETWEIVEQKLTEASMWLAVVRSAVEDARHPRRDEFLRRWTELTSQLGAVQTDLEQLAAEQQVAGLH